MVPPRPRRHRETRDSPGAGQGHPRAGGWTQDEWRPAVKAPRQPRGDRQSRHRSGADAASEGSLQEGSRQVLQSGRDGRCFHSYPAGSDTTSPRLCQNQAGPRECGRSARPRRPVRRGPCPALAAPHSHHRTPRTSSREGLSRLKPGVTQLGRGRGHRHRGLTQQGGPGWESAKGPGQGGPCRPSASASGDNDLTHRPPQAQP